MRIHIETVARIGKSVSIKRLKINDVEHVVAHLKFDGAILNREQMDGVCGQPDGWANLSFFNEQGSPCGWIDISLPKTSLSLTGRISGVTEGASISLTEAVVDGIVLSLADKGALMSANLSWIVSGDEASDLEPLLGRLCRIGCVIQDSGQGDLLKAA